MIYGSPWSCGWGDPNNMVAYWRAEQSGPYIHFWFTPRSGFGDAYYGIYRDAKFIKAVYVPGEQTRYVAIPCDSGVTGQSVFALFMGGAADLTLALSNIARVMESDNSPQATIDWTWPSEIMGGWGEGGNTSNWSLAGITYASIIADPGHRTRGYYNLEITVTGSAVSIEIDGGGDVLWSGSGTVGGTVTLSGVGAGSVATTAYLETCSARLYVRWPASMLVKRSPSYSTVATVPFNKNDVGHYTDGVLAAAAYTYKLQPVSDTATNGTLSGGDSGTIPGHPAPPTDLAYDSGDAAATDITWTASTTVGATYNIYIADIGGVLNFDDPYATGVTSPYTLPPFTGYGGKGYVVVRAVSGGGEEKNTNILTLEYDDAGDYVEPRPNVPQIDGPSESVSGLTVSLRGIYLMTGEEGAGATLQMFVRTPNGSYDFGTPDDEQTLTESPFNQNVLAATCSATLGAAGFYYVTMKAATAGGTISEDYADEILVYVSDSTMDAADEIVVVPSRG